MGDKGALNLILTDRRGAYSRFTVCDRKDFKSSRLNPSDSFAALFRHEKLNDIDIETFFY